MKVKILSFQHGVLTFLLEEVIDEDRRSDEATTDTTEEATTEDRSNHNEMEAAAHQKNLVVTAPKWHLHSQWV
jgi:hypothetical protein